MLAVGLQGGRRRHIVLAGGRGVRVGGAGGRGSHQAPRQELLVQQARQEAGRGQDLHAAGAHT